MSIITITPCVKIHNCINVTFLCEGFYFIWLSSPRCIILHHDYLEWRCIGSSTCWSASSPYIPLLPPPNMKPNLLSDEENEEDGVANNDDEQVDDGEEGVLIKMEPQCLLVTKIQVQLNWCSWWWRWRQSLQWFFLGQPDIVILGHRWVIHPAPGNFINFRQ